MTDITQTIAQHIADHNPTLHVEIQENDHRETIYIHNKATTYRRSLYLDFKDTTIHITEFSTQTDTRVGSRTGYHRQIDLNNPRSIPQLTLIINNRFHPNRNYP